MPRRRRLAGLALLMLSAPLGSAGFRLSMPAVAYLVREVLGASMTETSTLTVGFMAARATAAIAAGWLAERHGLLIPLIATGMLANGLLILAYSLARAWFWASAIRVAQGAFSGLTWPLIQLAVALMAPPKTRGRALAAYFALGSIGIMAGNLLYAAMRGMGLAAILSTACALYIAAALAATLGIMISGFEYAPGGQQQKRRQRARGRAWLFAAACYALALCGAPSTGDLIYVYLHEAINMGRGEAAAAVGLTGGVGLIIGYLLSWLADAGHEGGALALSAASIALFPLLLAIPSKPAAWVALMLAAAGMKSLTPLSRRVASRASEAALAIAAVNAAMNTGIASGQLVFGIACDLAESRGALTLAPLTVLPAGLAGVVLLTLAGVGLRRSEHAALPARRC